MPRLIILTVAAAIALVLAACANDAGAPTPSPTTTTPTPSPTSLPDVCLPNPDPATPEFQVLDAPDPFTEITSPVTVSGQINAFESVYQVSIFDAAGTTLAETFGSAQQPDIGVIGPFIKLVTFTVSEPTPACIWVFEESARDGSPVNVGQIPVVLVP